MKVIPPRNVDLRGPGTRRLQARVVAAMGDKPRAVRWLVAELIPFGWLAVAMLLIWAGAPPLGFVLGIFVAVPMTVVYLNWVQQISSIWVFPLIGLMLPATYLEDIILDNPAVQSGHAWYDSSSGSLIVTPAYWQALGGLLVALAVTVALACASGDRRRDRQLDFYRQRDLH